MNIPFVFSRFCDAIWEYRVSSNKVYFHKESIQKGSFNEWQEYDNVSKLYQDEYVYSLDVHIWKEFLTPEALRRFAVGKNDEKRFYIRIYNSVNELEWHEAYLYKYDADHIFLVSRNTREIQRDSIITQALLPEFDYVCYVDVATKEYALYYSDNNNTIVPQELHGDFEYILETYNRKYVVPEEAENLIRQMRIANVVKELEDKDEYILYTRIYDKGGIAYKKLRFSYADSQKTHLFLTRIDVGSIIGDEKLKEQEIARRLQLFDDMPVAFCSTKVLIDEDGKPYDFEFTYCNKAHEVLEGAQEDELVGKRFYEFFENADPKWLQFYYETAYQGIPHVIRDYSPEINKHLLLYTYRVEYGCCECVLLDVTERYFLMQEVQRSREIMQRVLAMTTDKVFQYFPERDTVMIYGKGAVHRTFAIEELCTYLVDKKFLAPESLVEFQNALLKIKNGENLVSLTIKGQLNARNEWRWLQMTMFDYNDISTHERKIIGFVQDITEYKNKEVLLQKQANEDSLTGVFNVASGKRLISQVLEKHKTTDKYYYTMFIFDLDNFKQINDTKGHMYGDKILIEFAELLRHTFRMEDIIYRLGGDEFVVFIDNLSDAATVIRVIIERFNRHLAEAKSRGFALDCSAGVFISNKQYSFDECYQQADQALYKAKRSGKGMFHVNFDGEDLMI